MIARRRMGLVAATIVVLAAGASAVPAVAGEVPGCYGKIGVIQLFPESDDSTVNQETWDYSSLSQAQNEIWAALEYWADKAAEAGAPLTFVNTKKYMPPDLLIGAEPISFPIADRCGWITPCMENLGYAQFFGSCEAEVQEMNDAHIASLGTDYNFSIFVVNNAQGRADGNGRFPGEGCEGTGSFAWWGKYVVALYDNPNYDVQNLDWVVAHEMGHVCWARDEYKTEKDVCPDCRCDASNNNFPNYNCEACFEGPTHVDCLMRKKTASLQDQNLCYYSQGMVGWTPRNYDLRVSRSGTGSGTVGSDPAGIDCGTDCTEEYKAGTVVSLTASPDSGSTFAGWQGGCSGGGTCEFAMTGDLEVDAVFSTAESPPGVVTQPASTVGQSSAVVNLSANPNGAATSVWFAWGLSETSLDATTPSTSIGSGTTAVERGHELTSLSCDTTYYFQAWADGAGLPVAGEVLSFRTTTCPGGGGGETEELIRNGDFSADDAYWSRTGNFYADDRYDAYGKYRSAPGYAYLSLNNGDPGNGIGGDLVQEVTIPDGATSITLSFWRYITTAEPSSSPGRDVLTVAVLDAGGALLETVGFYTNHDASSGYVLEQLDVGSYAGQTVRVRFRGTTSLTYPTVFRVDDVSLLVTHDTGDSAFDLAAFDAAVDDSTPTPGSKVRFSFSTTNYGDVTAPSNVDVAYYLEDIAVASDTEETALAPGQVDGEAESFYVPEAYGTYSAWACLDAYPEEPTLSNNCTEVLSITVQDDPAEGSDLVIAETTSSKTTVVEGEQFEMSALVRNIGNQSADLTSVVFVADQEGTIDRADFLLDDKAVNRLAAGRERLETQVVTAPFQPGTYLAGGCILGRSSETNTSNNCSPDPFTLTVLPRSCSPLDISLSNVYVTAREVHEACRSITAGPDVTVDPSGSLELSAPTVALADGFSVRAGGDLVIASNSGSASLEDDFENGTVDPLLWVHGGHSVVESGGVLQITADITDAGGWVESRELTIDPSRPVVLTRRAKVHYANDYYGGSLSFNWVGYPDYQFAINYSHYFYTAGDECATEGFAVTRYGANVHQCPEREVDGSPLIPGVWDQWFDERIEYDPVTGDLKYFIDGHLGVQFNVGPLPPGADTFYLKLSNWGWYTGHYHYSDDFLVTQG